MILQGEGSYTRTGPPRTVTYGYTEGFLTSVPGYASSISYHPNGMVYQLRHQNGVIDIQTVDASGMARPGEIYTNGARPNWSSGVYAYDGAGNITKIGADWYLYDGLSRLKEGTASAGAKRRTYSYDEFGNMTSIWTQGVGTKTLWVNHQTNRLAGSGYDAAGNQLSWGSGGETFSYAYYPSNQIRQITGGSPSVTRIYGYTADGERIGAYSSADPDAGVTYTIRDLEGHVLRRYLESNGVWTWKEDSIWGPRGLLATAGPTDGTRHYTLDHLGSPRLVTDGYWASQVARHDYYSFGEEATNPYQDTERMKFTGHERDLNLPGQTTDDLDSMHARYYSFNLARFMSVDPVGGSIGSSQSWNRYSYVKENPITFVDPRGFTDCKQTSRGVECTDEVGVTARDPNNGPGHKRPTVSGDDRLSDVEQFRLWTYERREAARLGTTGPYADPYREMLRVAGGRGVEREPRSHF